jgi:integrase
MGKRRGHGEGSIFKRKDGRWAAAISLPSGRRKYLYAKTRQEVARKLTQALRAVQDGIPLPPERQSLGSYLREWLESVGPSLRPRTWERYEQYVRLHIVPHLGRIALARLTPAHLQRLYAQKLEAGLSPTTVAHLHAVLHRALAQAERWGLVARNVAALVTPPRPARREMKALSPEEARRFLEAAQGERLHAFYVLALTTGMRLGELLALRWRDVDLERGVLQVRATLQRTRDGYTFAEPKTERSRRQVVLSPLAAEALRAHRLRLLEERLRLGEAWEDHDLVFPNEVGRPLDPANVTHRSFQRILRRAGLPHIRFHDLRHTTATLLLGQGVHPKVVADMLGHSTISITLDLYSHSTPALHRQAALALEALLATEGVAAPPVSRGTP